MFRPFIITAITLFFLTWVVPTVSYGHWTTLIIASIVLTILQKVVKPVLNLLFLPINIVTLGFFSVVINVGLLWSATFLVPGFSIEPIALFGVNLPQFASLIVVSFMISLFQNLLGIFL